MSPKNKRLRPGNGSDDTMIVTIRSSTQRASVSYAIDGCGKPSHSVKTSPPADSSKCSHERRALRLRRGRYLVTSVAGRNPGRELGTILHLELPQDVRDMSLDRLARQEQRARDIRVGGAA